MTELFDQRYVVFRNDRNGGNNVNGRGGGVLIGIKTNLIINCCLFQTNEDGFEDLCSLVFFI